MKLLLGNHGEGTSREVLPVPLAADLCLPGLGDVVRHAECEVSVVLDGNKLHRDIGPTHTNLQEATPSSVATVDGEAAGIAQTLDKALGGIRWGTDTLDLKWTVRDVLVGKFEVHSVNSRFRSSVFHLNIVIQA